MSFQEWLTLAIVATQYLANWRSLKTHQNTIARLTAQNNALARKASVDNVAAFVNAPEHGVLDDTSEVKR